MGFSSVGCSPANADCTEDDEVENGCPKAFAGELGVLALIIDDTDLGILSSS